MAKLVQIIGTDKVLAMMRKNQAQLALRTALGLKACGLLLQRESQRLVPVDTGNLKASSFTRATGVGFGMNVTVGYTAAYALFVHEAVGMVLKGQARTTKGRYWDPQGRAKAKFLEEPARRLRPAFVAILKKFTTIK